MANFQAMLVQCTVNGFPQSTQSTFVLVHTNKACSQWFLLYSIPNCHSILEYFGLKFAVKLCERPFPISIKQYHLVQRCQNPDLKPTQNLGNELGFPTTKANLTHALLVKLCWYNRILLAMALEWDLLQWCIGDLFASFWPCGVCVHMERRYVEM